MTSEKRRSVAQLRRVLVLHGPNLNLLGVREPDIYGTTTLREIDERLKEVGRELGLDVETFQSNSEGALIDRIQEARGLVEAVIINPAGYTHTSVAIRDALAALGVPLVEVHLSNVYRREPFRHTSTIASLVEGRVMGFGAVGYELALRGVAELLVRGPSKQSEKDA